MFQPERLLGAVLQEALGSSLGGHRSSRRHRSYGGASNRALGMGLLGLAIGAFEHFSAQSSAANAAGGASTLSSTPPPPPAGAARPPSAPPPIPPGAAVSPAVLAIRAMFAAAASDGAIDEIEKTRILERVRQSGPSAEDESFIAEELANPCTVTELLRQAERAKLSGELKEQVYLAAFLAIDMDTDAERAFFRDLAQGLGLTKTQVTALEQSTL